MRKEVFGESPFPSACPLNWSITSESCRAPVSFVPPLFPGVPLGLSCAGLAEVVSSLDSQSLPIFQFFSRPSAASHSPAKPMHNACSMNGPFLFHFPRSDFRLLRALLTLPFFSFARPSETGVFGSDALARTSEEEVPEPFRALRLTLLSCRLLRE